MPFRYLGILTKVSSFKKEKGKRKKEKGKAKKTKSKRETKTRKHEKKNLKRSAFTPVYINHSGCF